MGQAKMLSRLSPDKFKADDYQSKPRLEIGNDAGILAPSKHKAVRLPMAKPDAIFLETERMYFRRFRVEDAQLLFELDSDPEVMRFISKGQPTPLARIQNEFIPRFLDYYKQTPPRGFWAAHLRRNKEFIGWFHLRPDRISPGEMELGYRLKRSTGDAAWRRRVHGPCSNTPAANGATPKFVPARWPAIWPPVASWKRPASHSRPNFIMGRTYCPAGPKRNDAPSNTQPQAGHLRGLFECRARTV
jgi:hypothetical protein